MPNRRLLVVKTSSMGDLIHTLSAVEEARRHCPGLMVDWVCEEAFVDIPSLCGAIDRVIPVAIRRWRKNWLAKTTRTEIRDFIRELRKVEYDLVIDAQGLMKSAWITMAARCPSTERWGFDRSSIREPLALLALRKTVHAPAQWHAIERLRTLFGAALGYTPSGPVACLAHSIQPGGVASPTTVLLLHGTTRAEKSWPVDAWSELGRQLVADGHAVVIPWGTKHERTTAERIAVNIGDGARVLPEMSIGELAARVQNSLGVIGVDSGLMHLSVALGRPTVAVMTASHLPRFSAVSFRAILGCACPGGGIDTP